MRPYLKRILRLVSTLAATGIAAVTASAQSGSDSYYVFTLSGNLTLPGGLVFDAARRLYVCDSYAYRILLCDEWGTPRTAFDTGQFGSPDGLVVDGDGTMFVADAFKPAILRISASGAVTTFAGTVGKAGYADGTGTSAVFNYPRGITRDSSGNFFVTEDNAVIRKITPAGVVTTFAGQVGVLGSADGVGRSATFTRPWGITIDANNNLYVACSDSIRRITPDAVVTTLPRPLVPFRSPNGIAIDAAGRLYVTDTYNKTVRRIDPSGAVVTLAGQSGAERASIDGNGAIARFLSPSGIAVTPDGKSIYVTDADIVNATIRLIVADPAPQTAAPRFAVEPYDQVVESSGTVTLRGIALGASPMAFQWYFNGVAIAGATNASYSLSNASSKDVGSYVVVAANAVGSKQSRAVRVDVKAAPVIVNLPQTPFLRPDGSAVLSVDVTGSGPFTYQWFKDGVQVQSGTASIYTATESASYVVLVTNPYGNAASRPFYVLPSKRVVNLSTRGFVAGDLTLTAGLVVGGSTTSPVTRQILVRGVGPSLELFGVTGVLRDPQLVVHDAQGNVSETNTGWENVGNGTAVARAAAAAGAFPFTSGVRDAAILLSVGPGARTIELKSASGGSGNALLEVYEVSPDLTRFINLSTRGVVGFNGEGVIAGFVVDGTAPVRVLLRGIGPGLGRFELQGTLRHPVLSLIGNGTVLATNTGWNSDAVAGSEIAAAGKAAGAFALTTPEDTAMVMTLQPGAYSLKLNSADNGAGLGLVEVYEIP